jgi:hypothetical protein
LAPWPSGTPLTSPLSVSGSHDHVCIAPDSWPSQQTVPSGRSTVIAQRPPTSCASPLHPLELAMCARQPVGPQVELTIHVVRAPGSPLLSSQYVPSNGSHAHAGPARPTAATAAIVVAVRPQAMGTMFRLLADSKFSREAMAVVAVGRGQWIYSPRSGIPTCCLLSQRQTLTWADRPSWSQSVPLCLTRLDPLTPASPRWCRQFRHKLE